MSAPVPESVVASALKNPPAEEGPPVSTLSEIDQGQLGSSTGSAAAVAAPAVVVAGIVFLLLRPSLAALPRGGVALLAAGYLGLGATSLAVAGRDLAGLAPAAGTGTGRERLGVLPVLAVGVAAVGLATLVAGPAPALAGGRAPVAVALDLLAAVAEEALFRRVLFGWLLRWGVPVAVAGSALVFALVHVPLYGIAVLPVDLGAGLLFSWQRAATGRWSVPAATHAAANLLAVIIR